ncbi:adenylate/guanylate cyclase domain-containing protein [Bacteroidota bacterium]
MPEDRRLAAIMFTDIVGYTALMGSDEDKAFQLLRKNRDLQRPLIKKYKGEWLKEMGDGILASFNTASDAVRCAGEIQNAAKKAGIGLRIGIHEGEVVFEGSDVLGDGVNVASRLEELAEEGCINISGAVYKDIKNKAGITTELVGEKSLKNVEDPIKVYKVCYEEEPAPSTEQPARKNRLLYYIIAGLVVVIAAILILQFLPTKETKQPTPEEATVEIDKSIAVLPFKSLSDDPEKQYLADGVMDAILLHLSKIEDLRVISRTSVEQFRDPNKTIGEIANELNVSYILEGSFQKYGDKARLIVQLIYAKEEGHDWSNEYNRDWSDIFSVQSEVAQKIASELHAVITQEEGDRIGSIPTENLEAYELYLKGRHFQNTRSEEGIRKAIKYYQDAIQLDPDYAISYAGIAQSYALLTFYGGLPNSEVLPKVEEAAFKALDLDNKLGEAYFALGIVKDLEGDLIGAAEQYKLAIDLNPNNAETHHRYGYTLSWLDRIEEGIREAKIALELEPINPIMMRGLGLVYYYALQYDLAIAECNKCIEIDPNQTFAYWILFFAFHQKMMYEEAISALEKRLIILEYEDCAASLRQTFEDSGYIEAIKQQLDNSMNQEIQCPSYDPYGKSLFYAMIGENDQAFEWLEKVDMAVEIHSLKVDPLFKPLRSDPRWQLMLDKVGFPE